MTVKTLLRNQPNRDGSYTIRIRVIENRKSRFIPTGEKIHKSYWDLNKERVKDNHPESIRINAKIESLKPIELKDSIMSDSGNFLTYWDDYIRSIQGVRRIGEVNKHITSKNIFMNFMGKNFYFTDLNHDNVKDYISKLYSYYDNKNTAYSYLKKFRRVVNEALADGRIMVDPFSRIRRIESQDVESKALTREQFQNFKTLPVYPQLKKYKDIWFSLLYLHGCRIGDLLRMRFRDIEGQYIIYTMTKTGKKMTIEIKDPLYKIIFEMNEFRYPDIKFLPFVSNMHNLQTLVTNHPDDYIFPFLENGVHNVPRVITRGHKKGEWISGLESEYKSVSSFTATINKRLKDISKFLNTNITTHSARHTYATFLKGKTDDIYKIMHILGHSSVVVTERYLASLPKFELHELNDELISELSQVLIDDVVDKMNIAI